MSWPIVSIAFSKSLSGIYLIKVNNRNTRTRCEICSKLTIMTSNVVLVSLLLALNIFPTLLQCFIVNIEHEYCWLSSIISIIISFSQPFNYLSANPTKWSNTLKQFIVKLSTNFLNEFDNFVKLSVKGLKFCHLKITGKIQWCNFCGKQADNCF